ncbi:MAG: virulence factor SrfB [Verrucomicrobiaceae bacterium]
MSDIPTTITPIKVFAESGHHYTFVLFNAELLKTHPMLRSLCEKEQVPWHDISHKWLRGRFGMNEGQHGMWVVLESNLGDITRGSICEPKRAYHAAEAGQHSADNISPYAAVSDTRLPDDVETIPIDLELDGKTVTIASLEVIWKKPSGEPRDVDLIVDFGNTRTVVLALEHNYAQAGKLSTLCHNIRFIKRGADYAAFAGSKQDDTCSIVDSWFILHEPMFADNEPPRPGFEPVTEIQKTETQIKEGLLGKTRVETHYSGTQRVPQMFVELSPVVMGDSARNILANLNLNDGGNYTLSSPKRYAWDKDSLDVEQREWWTMVHNHWSTEARRQTQLPKLKGSMLRFLPIDGRDWSIDAPPNEDEDFARRPTAAPDRPSYPRADAMTWAALSILELAARQITSEQWRAGNGEFVPRRLRRVLVTYPSGWTTQEKADYQAKWQKAVNIFTLAHLRDRRPIKDGGCQPELVMNLDEAVASQLPIIYSEILRLDNKGENWIELIGRGKGTEARARVMTVDIGGGTSDISIIEYRDALAGKGVELEARLLFRDSSSIAGDSLAKEVIESVLLPALGARFQGNDRQMADFEDIFKGAAKKSSEQARWSRIVKLVFMPIIRQWLKDLSEGRDTSAEGTSWSPDRIMGSEGRLVDPGALQEFNDICRDKMEVDVMPDQDPIFHDTVRLRLCIDLVFRPLVQSLAKYVTAFGVDLITLSGKPSELPQVKRLLEDFLPIMPQRILQAKNYPAGDWYPMSSNNCINDAKTVTAVGAALYQAIQHGLVSDWNIKSVDDFGRTFPYYWGAMPGKAMPWKFDPLYLDPNLSTVAKDDDMPGKSCVNVAMQVGTHIGRKILPSAAKPEQVYRLRWKDRKRALAEGFPIAHTVIITLERDAEDPTRLKQLMPQSYKSRDGRSLENTGGLELQLCTLEDEDFWVDSGRFDIVWPEAAA